jgi:truncated hemoglobin YjbI
VHRLGQGWSCWRKSGNARRYGRELSPDQKERWIHLMLETAQEVLPKDTQLQARFADYIRWGTQIAVEVSQPGFEIEHVGPVLEETTA